MARRGEAVKAAGKLPFPRGSKEHLEPPAPANCSECSEWITGIERLLEMEMPDSCLVPVIRAQLLQRELHVLKTCFERKGQMVYLHYNLKNKREMCVYKTHSDDTESSDQSHF